MASVKLMASYEICCEGFHDYIQAGSTFRRKMGLIMQEKQQFIHLAKQLYIINNIYSGLGYVNILVAIAVTRSEIKLTSQTTIL